MWSVSVGNVWNRKKFREAPVLLRRRACGLMEMMVDQSGVGGASMGIGGPGWGCCGSVVGRETNIGRNGEWANEMG